MKTEIESFMASMEDTPDGHLSRGNPIKSRIKTILLIRATTSAERYCNEEQYYGGLPRPS